MEGVLAEQQGRPHGDKMGLSVIRSKEPDLCSSFF